MSIIVKTEINTNYDTIKLISLLFAIAVEGIGMDKVNELIEEGNMQHLIKVEKRT